MAHLWVAWRTAWVGAARVRQAEVPQSRPLRLRAHPTLRSPRHALKKGSVHGANAGTPDGARPRYVIFK